MRYAILMNGPPGIGKSWLSLRIHELLTNELGIKACITHPVQPAIDHCLAQARWRGSYADFKEAMFDGITGRQVIINTIEEKRRIDPYYWLRKLEYSEKYRRSDVVILESIGRADEQKYFEIYTFDYVTIVMCDDSYAIGENWRLEDGSLDSRQRLEAINGFTQPDSNAAFKEFNRRLSDARINPDKYSEFWYSISNGVSVGR